MLKFRSSYFILTIFFLITEILIALFINDKIIRPFVGDVLVVILMYCFVRSFFILKVKWAISLVLGIAFLVEGLQYLRLLQLLGLEGSTPANVILGNTFSATDLLMYLLGAVIILFAEKLSHKQKFFCRSSS